MPCPRKGEESETAHVKIAAPLSQPHVHSSFIIYFENTIASTRSCSREAVFQLSSFLNLVSGRNIFRQKEEYINIYLRENQ